MEGDGLMPNIELFIQGKQDAATTLKKGQEQGDKLLDQNAAGKYLEMWGRVNPPFLWKGEFSWHR
jgi:hypothetical protein